MTNQNQEDYLQAMYRIIEKDSNAKIRSVDISKELKVSKSAVSQMLRKLETNQLVVVKPYSFIQLTDNGLSIAKNLVYNHRIIELFLFKVLHLDKDEVHAEAHKLEHAMSNKTVSQMSIFLKKLDLTSSETDKCNF